MAERGANNNSKRSEEEISRHLENIMGSINTTNDISYTPEITKPKVVSTPPPTPIPQTKLTRDPIIGYGDFLKFKEDAIIEANKFVMSIATIYFSEIECHTNEMIRCAIESDVIIMSGILNQIKGSEHIIMKTREEIDLGYSSKEVLVGLHSLEKTMIEWYKNFGNFKNNIRNFYAQTSSELHVIEKSVIQKPVVENVVVQQKEEKIVSKGLRVYGSKELLKTLKSSASDLSENNDIQL